MATEQKTLDIQDTLVASLLSDENFSPTRPVSIEETGLGEEFLEQLICKYLVVFGTSKGRTIADNICLPFNIVETILGTLRTNQFLVHAGSASFNDYYYSLTNQGRERATAFLEACAYVGPAPVPLMDYVISVEAQSITAETPGPERLVEAVRGISVDPGLFESLGPAINSGAGMFLYGAPGNGKSTLAKRITLCFGQEIWIPHALYEDGQVIKFYDSAYHKQVVNDERSIIKCGEYDRRWLKISRPTVVVGGELTMDNLELRHDPRTNINEAPLQMKSNCGCLLIDDFGRQRIEPDQLLNRWIVPLEMRHDFLTLPTGKKLQVPFDQLVIFSTNLEPRDLVDEAFLRRIPFKIEIGDPSEEEFHELFELYARSFGCEYRREIIDDLIDQALPADQPAAPPLSRPRPVVADPQLLQLHGPAHGTAAGLFRPGREELLCHRARRTVAGPRPHGCRPNRIDTMDTAAAPPDVPNGRADPRLPDARADRRRRIWRSVEGRGPGRDRQGDQSGLRLPRRRAGHARAECPESHQAGATPVPPVPGTDRAGRRPPGDRHRAGHFEPEEPVRRSTASRACPAFPAESCSRCWEMPPTPWTTSRKEHSLQHLDIKPENLLLVGGRTKVADFGLVKDLQDVNCSMVGGLTPVYAAPELFDGRPNVHSDQYSLAIVYQEMLTGVLPYEGRTTAQLAAQHLHSRPHLDSLPFADQETIARALSKNPSQRFPSCRAMIDSLVAGEGGARARTRAGGGNAWRPPDAACPRR